MSGAKIWFETKWKRTKQLVNIQVFLSYIAITFIIRGKETWAHTVFLKEVRCWSNDAHYNLCSLAGICQNKAFWILAVLSFKLHLWLSSFLLPQLHWVKQQNAVHEEKKAHRESIVQKCSEQRTCVPKIRNQRLLIIVIIRVNHGHWKGWHTA